MTVKELTQEQMYVLKQAYLTEYLHREEGRWPYFGELAVADELVSDEEIFAEYGNTLFSPDDFMC